MSTIIPQGRGVEQPPRHADGSINVLMPNGALVIQPAGKVLILAADGGQVLAYDENAVPASVPAETITPNSTLAKKEDAVSSSEAKKAAITSVERVHAVSFVRLCCTSS